MESASEPPDTSSTVGGVLLSSHALTSGSFSSSRKRCAFSGGMFGAVWAHTGSASERRNATARSKAVAKCLSRRWVRSGASDRRPASCVALRHVNKRTIFTSQSLVSCVEIESVLGSTDFEQQCHKRHSKETASPSRSELDGCTQDRTAHDDV